MGCWNRREIGNHFFQQEKADIQLLNKHIIKGLDPSISQLEQTPKSITTFLENNEYILCSPGIPLHNYKKYDHKFITELDIIQDRYAKPIIAVTGTAGKTTITHLLQNIFNEYKPTIAAGNIGYPMLNLLTKNHNEEFAVIEVSSFQLQHTKSFAPDCAVITNFFLNHLDYHKSEAEYREAKNQLLRYQNKNQIKIVPELFAHQKNNGSAQTYIFAKEENEQADFYIKENSIWHKENKLITLYKLPSYTFPENWLIIIATLHLHKINITDSLCEKLDNFIVPEHRLKVFAQYNGTTFYNDSKSTIWQSTAHAIEQVEKPAALFLGGLSKNIDRAPLF